MRFVANLRKETIEAFGVQGIQPAAYLLSSHRISNSALKAAKTIRRLDLPLFADNGTKVLIGETTTLFKEPAREIRLEVKALRKNFGRIPRGRQIPKDLRERASDLAKQVVQHTVSISEQLDSEDLLQKQLMMDPTDLIAQEDFAIACLIGLDLERETTGWRISRFDTRNRRSLKLWKRVATDPRCKNIRVYAVLSAMDYNTARSAGRIASAKGAKNVALGIAGITLDPSAADFFVMERSSFRLRRPVPRRYLRLSQVLRGFADGFSDAGETMDNFHCLGLGAPAMFPIPAAAISEETNLTTDATSPIHDAVRDRVFYHPEQQGERANTLRIVKGIVQDVDWPFVSPFSRSFRESFGHDPTLARTWWKQNGEIILAKAHLRTPSDLTTALPLFSEADSTIRIEAQKARIAHNHWVLGNLAEGFRDGIGRRNVALSSIATWISRGETVTTRGLEAALEIMLRE